MNRKLNNKYKSILKGMERAKKLKDLEIAKALEINNLTVNNNSLDKKDLPKK